MKVNEGWLKMKTSGLVYIVVMSMFLMSSSLLVLDLCADGHEKEEPVSYYKQIMPILKRSCQGCHHPGDPNADFIVTSYAELKRGGMAGEAIIPQKPDESLIIELITGDPPAMPQKPRTPHG